MKMYAGRKVILQLFSLFILVSGLVVFDACGEPQGKDYCEKTADCTKKFDQSYHCKNNKCEKKQVVACEKDGDCLDGEMCTSDGQCVTKTVTEGTTNDEQTADGGSGEPVVTKDDGGCSCPGDKKCNPVTKECVDCLEDADCNGGTDACTTDCTGSGKVCNKKTYECEEKTCECPLGQTCNATSKVCETTVTCPDGSKPDANGKCPVPCSGTTCGAGEIPDPNQNCTCIKTKWCSACTADADCGPGGKCTSYQGQKFCAEDCTNTGACSDVAYQCLNHGAYKSCVPTSGSCPCLGTTCQGSQTCCVADGACHECCDDSQCTGGKICNNVTFTCADDLCKGVTCTGTSVCNPGTGKCDCPANCPQGECCGTDGQCSAAACGSTSTCNPPCQSGQICCNLMGMGQSCQPQSMAALCGGGGTGGCQSDADCTDPSKSKCCAAAIPLLPKSCQASCGGGTGGCQSDADCSSGEKCCGGLPPLLPNSCKPAAQCP